MAGTATLPNKTDRTPKLEHKAVPVSGFKVLDEAQGIVSTFVSVTGVVDEVKDRIIPGAYEKTLASRTPKGVWSHDWDLPVSKTISVEEVRPGDPRLPKKTRTGEDWPAEAGGLLVKTQFNLDTQRGSEAFSDVKFYGEEQEWSIGYNVPVGGAKIDRKTGVREIVEIELFEYSPVLFGAMPLTVTTDVKTAQAAFAEIGSKEATKPHDYRGDDGEPCQICGETANHEMHIGSDKWEEANGKDGEKTVRVGTWDVGLSAWKAAKLEEKQEGDPSALIEWFNDGADGQIDWGSDGDFEDCVRIASDHMDEDAARGFCNERHQDAVGGAPGSENSSSARTPAETKSAISSHSTETSTASWDGSAQEGKLSNDDGASVYRKMYAWVDPDADADTKSAYKFPHHFVSDGTPGAASTAASSATIASLNGGRGGTSVPEGDRKGVWNHVAKHLRDADMEPAELKALLEGVGAKVVESHDRLLLVPEAKDLPTVDLGPATKQTVTTGAITEPGIGTASPTGQGIEPQFGGVERGGVVTGGALASMSVTENHGSCPADRSFGVTAGGVLVACVATREEADSMVGAAKIARKAVEAKPFEIEERDGKYCVVNADTGDVKGCHDTREEAEAQRRALYANTGDEAKKLQQTKGVPVDTGPEGLDQGELETMYAVGAYSAVCNLVEELDSGLDALQGAIGRGDTDAADAYWTAVMNAADALLAGLGVDDTDAIEGAQRLSGDGWDPECDPGTMAQATDACVDLGYAAWQAGNFAQAAALAFAADCSVDELMDWFGLDDDGLLVVPSSYYDEWSAGLPEAVKAGKLDERIAVLKTYGQKEGRVLSGSNADSLIGVVGSLIEILDGAGVPHPFQTGTGEEPGTGSNADVISPDSVEVVSGDTNKDTLKTGESGETKDADGEMTLGELTALVERAKSFRADL